MVLARHHSTLLHDSVWVRHCLIVAVTFWLWQFYVTLLRAGCGWERCSAPGLFAVHSTWFQRRLGIAVGVGDVGGGFGRHDFTRRRSIHHQPVWLARSVCVTRRPCIVTGLALSWRYIRERGAVGHESAPIPTLE